MKKIFIMAVAGLFAGTVTLSAQRTILIGADRPEEPIKVLSPTSTMVGEMVNFDFVLNYDNLLLDTSEELVVTPYIYKDGNMLRMPPIVFMGERYYNRHERSNTLYGQNDGDMMPFERIVFSNQDLRDMRQAMRSKDAQNTELMPTRENSVQYTASFPFSTWMDGASIALSRNRDGYRGQEIYASNTDLGVLFNPIQPQVSFIVPQYEMVKARRDQMTSNLNFIVNKTEIRRDIFNNAQELDQIYTFTDKIMQNPDVKVSGLKLTGYASPEGRYAHNNTLAQGRVDALRETLARRYNVDRNLVTIDHVAEDWDSVARWVENSNMRYRTEILDIIRTTPDPDARDAKIRRLDNNTTYNMLLSQVYPGLRRVEYEIDYVVEPMTVERGIAVMRTNPNHLSLEEYYRIAMSYPVNSPQYVEAFETALRQYPNDPVANNNMAAIAISRGDYDAARRYLEKCRDNDMAMNNLGIIYVLEGDYARAEQAFQRAMRSGVTEAQYNQQNLYSIR